MTILNVLNDFTATGARFKKEDKIVICDNNEVYLFRSDKNKTERFDFVNVAFLEIKKIFDNSYIIHSV